MKILRASVLALGLALGIVLNVTVAPQIYTPRPPVFNGPDVAENWEWRSMAIQTHSWWLWEQFPEASVSHVQMTTPPGADNLLPVGMAFTQRFEELRTLTIDTTLPPLDLVGLGINDDLANYYKVYSRIHCRSGQEMVKRDTCYYFVAWDDSLLGSEPPHFVGVRTNAEEGAEEMGLVEERLLERISPIAPEKLLSVDEVRQ